MQKASGAQRMPVTTTESVGSTGVTGYIGYVIGLVLTHDDPSSGHEAEAQRISDRHEAVRRLVESAEALRADAVVGLRFDAIRSGVDTVEVLAYGTAVSLAPF